MYGDDELSKLLIRPNLAELGRGIMARAEPHGLCNDLLLCRELLLLLLSWWQRR